MYLLIPYDITDDKRRRRIEKVLSSHGKRVNYSVFEVETDRVRYRKLIEALKHFSDPKTDHIRIYLLNKESLKKSFILHSQHEVFDHEELYV